MSDRPHRRPTRCDRECRAFVAALAAATVTMLALTLGTDLTGLLRTLVSASAAAFAGAAVFVLTGPVVGSGPVSADADR